MNRGLLICTFISENQGLDESRALENFQVLHTWIFLGLWYKSSFFLGGDLKKQNLGFNF